MKKICLILISLFLGLNVILASTNTFPRTDDNLGVNKKWKITEKNIDNVKNTPLVDASEKIYDFASILTEEEEKSLYDQISEYIEYTNMDMVVLTIDEELSDWGIENYAADFYDYNDFGIDFDKYSGVIIVRNINSYNLFYGIYTFGNAQLYYNHVIDYILDDIYDDLHSEKYLDGFSRFISLSRQYYDKGANEDYYIDDNGYMKKVYKTPWFLAFSASSIITLITMLILVKKNKMIKKETLASVYINKNSIKYNNQVDKFLHTHTSSYVISHSSGGSGGSHSGSSGGGHGGGGRHG